MTGLFLLSTAGAQSVCVSCMKSHTDRILLYVPRENDIVNESVGESWTVFDVTDVTVFVCAWGCKAVSSIQGTCVSKTNYTC